MITLLALLLGAFTPAELVLEAVQFFVDLKRDVDGTLQHAKKKTRRLCQAVEFAGDYLKLFEGPAEELDGSLDADRRHLLTKHLVNLSKSIVSAKELVEDLKKKSRAAWFAHGGSFRDQLVAMTEQVRRRQRRLLRWSEGGEATQWPLDSRSMRCRACAPGGVAAAGDAHGQPAQDAVDGHARGGAAQQQQAADAAESGSGQAAARRAGPGRSDPCVRADRERARGSHRYRCCFDVCGDELSYWFRVRT